MRRRRLGLRRLRRRLRRCRLGLCRRRLLGLGRRRRLAFLDESLRDLLIHGRCWLRRRRLLLVLWSRHDIPHRQKFESGQSRRKGGAHDGGGLRRLGGLRHGHLGLLRRGLRRRRLGHLLDHLLLLRLLSHLLLLNHLLLLLRRLRRLLRLLRLDGLLLLNHLLLLRAVNSRA
eukprot:COSAG04_NODE_690_length_11140_cov_13.093651_2_plen_173_part_00